MSSIIPWWWILRHRQGQRQRQTKFQEEWVNVFRTKFPIVMYMGWSVPCSWHPLSTSKTKTKTKTECLKDPTYAMFLKARGSRISNMTLINRIQTASGPHSDRIQTRDFILADLILELALHFAFHSTHCHILDFQSISYHCNQVWTWEVLFEMRYLARGGKKEIECFSVGRD